jgi:multidrug efflux pump subunit AcrA (membrane-fusion protein)
MNMKKKSSLLIAVLLIAGIAGGGVWYVQSRASQDPEKRYRIAEVVRGEVIQAVSANGTLNPVVLAEPGHDRHPHQRFRRRHAEACTEQGSSNQVPGIPVV